MKTLPEVAVAERRLFYGWYVVLSSALIVFYGSGFFYYGFSAFFTPLVDEFGWTRAATAFAFTMNQLVGALVVPIIGLIFDRVGPRTLVRFGVVTWGLGFIAMSQIHDYVALCASVVLIGIGFNTGMPYTAMATVANWFIRRRGLALGLLMAGGGLGGAIAPLLVTAIESYGWRQTALIVGASAIVLLLPLTWLIRRRPEDQGLLPDGDAIPAQQSLARAARAASDGGIRAELHYTPRQALATRAFWCCVISFSLSMATQNALFVHAIPFFISIGQTETFGGLAIAWITIVSLVGRLGAGWLGDRLNKPKLMAAMIALQVTGILVFSQLSAVWMIPIFVLLFAPSYGGMVPTRPGLLAELFGRRSIAAIQGLVMCFASLAQVTGPVFAGWMFDISGSYRLAFLILGIVAAMALPAMLLLMRQPEGRALRGGAQSPLA